MINSIRTVAVKALSIGEGLGEAITGIKFMEKSPR
jgi:hypothetical protein